MRPGGDESWTERRREGDRGEGEKVTARGNKHFVYGNFLFFHLIKYSILVIPCIFDFNVLKKYIAVFSILCEIRYWWAGMIYKTLKRNLLHIP